MINYLLRYAVGTIVGGAIVAYLFTRLPESVRAQVPQLDAWGKMTALAAAGLAFCYIASAPLLVYHVGRNLFLSKEFEKKKTGLAISGVTLLVLFFGNWLVAKESIETSAAYASLGSFFCAQAIVITALHQKRDSVSGFYRRLADARKAATSDIVESYRGIREHGNAYSIVLVETLLGLVLSGLLGDPKDVKSADSVFGIFLALIGVWVMPASFMLFTAARIETDFVDEFEASCKK